MISTWKYVLWPLALLNRFKLGLRARLFDLGIWKSVEFEMPVVFVGSLTRTHTLGISLYIQNLLKAALHIKRDIITSHALTPETKEPYLYLHAYAPLVFSTSHKVLGLSEWFQYHTDSSAIVMNNEFVQNEVRPRLKILVSDFEFPFYHDALWPVGNLHGTKADIRTSDLILICATPENADLNKIKDNLQFYLGIKGPVYFIKNSVASLNTFNSSDKIEFIQDRDNFERLILNVLQNANPDSE